MAGSWLLAPGSWLLAPGSWLLAPGSWLLAPGSWLLAPGSWLLAITNDWQDADAYRVYDAEAEHNRLRREIFAVICEEIARVQFTIDQDATQ